MSEQKDKDKGKRDYRNTSGLVQWVKGQSGNPNGRPKKMVTKAKEFGYTNSQVNDTLKVLLTMNYTDLEMVAEDNQATMLEALVSKALIKGHKKGDMKVLDTLLSRVFGQPKQSFETTITEQPIFPVDKNDPIYLKEKDDTK
jgi:hypothetical protein